MNCAGALKQDGKLVLLLQRFARSRMPLEMPGIECL
jgi:hypothetical protein